VLELFLSFWVSRTVMAAVEMGVFDLLAGEPLDLSSAGGRLGLDERPARALLDTCVAAGLLAMDGDRYRCSDAGARYLTSTSEYSLRNYVLDERWCWEGWGQLEELLRQNRQALPPDAGGYHDFPADFFLDFLHGHSLAMGERLADVVDFSHSRSLMDVAGGSGAVSIALCRRYPQLRSVVVDQQPVLVRTAQHVAEAGLTDRIATRAVDIFEGSLPTGCDTAVLSSLLHDFSPERCRQLLGRLPVDRVVILEIVPDDDRSGPLLPVVFSVAMVVNTAGGAAHTEADYREWLSDAGFVDITSMSTGGRMVTRVIDARR